MKSNWNLIIYIQLKLQYLVKKYYKFLLQHIKNKKKQNILKYFKKLDKI